jgi:hypothetical protein
MNKNIQNNETYLSQLLFIFLHLITQQPQRQPFKENGDKTYSTLFLGSNHQVTRCNTRFTQTLISGEHRDAYIF